MAVRDFCDADEEVSFIWDNDYDEEKRINSYALTLFVQEEDNRYERFDEYHPDKETLKRMVVELFYKEVK